METAPTLPLDVIGPVLFTLIGPVSLIPLFAAATEGASPGLRLRIALAAGAIGFGGLMLAIVAAVPMMEGWGISPPALVIAAGVILTVIALRRIVVGGDGGAGPGGPPSLRTALVPIAIPGIISPVGVAVLAIAVAYFRDWASQLAVLGVVLIIVVINVAAMLIAPWFMRRIGMAPLTVLGAIFGVLQVALGVEMVLSGIELAGR